VSERDREIDSLFDRVLDAPREQRESILSACGELRADVEELIAAHESMGGEFLAAPAGERLQPCQFEPGDRIGRYTVRRVIASGGSGTVYEAEQDRPHRTVALKVMHSGLGSDRAQQRFQEEAETLARLDHPDIAHVYEAGDHAGVPYIAIEYVEDARTVLEHCASVDRRDRLEFFAAICDAVHHGHQQGIIHRDLKPANVLVKGGRPKVVDFGIARREDSGEREIAGTVAYMSPEQCEIDAHLDVRTDVYALGVMLHELLRGRLPYDVSTTSITDAARVIRESPPAPLGICADLDAIAAMALMKSRADRYASAAALAEDVRRYLRREPVAARRAGRLHHLELFVRRQPGLSVAMIALLLVLVAGVLVSVRFALRAERRRVEGERETYRATVVAAAAALRVHDVEGARTELLRSPANLRNWEWRHLLSLSDVSERTLRWKGRMFYTGGVAADVPRVAATSNAGARVWDLRTGNLISEVPRVKYLYTACALSPDGERLVLGDQRATLHIRDATSGDLIRAVTEEPRTSVWAITFAPDGKRFAVGRVGGTLSILKANGDSVGRLQGHESTVMSLAYHPDGRRLFSGGADRTIRIWNLEAGQEIGRLEGHTDNVESLAISRDGDRLVSGSLDATVRIWDARTGAAIRTLSGHARGVKVVAVAPDGLTFVSGSLDHTLRICDRDGDERAVLTGHTTMIRGVGFTPDSETLVSIGRDETVKLWNARRAGIVPSFLGLGRRLTQVVFTPDGNLAAVTREGRSIRWDRATGRPIGESTRNGVALLLDGGASRLTAHRREGVWVDDAITGEKMRTLGTLDVFCPCSIAAVPGRSLVALGEETGRVSLWSPERPGAIRSWTAHPEKVIALAADPTGTMLATGHRLDPVRLWRIDDGALIAELPSGPYEVFSLAFSPDGETLAVGLSRGPLLLVDIQSRRIRAELSGHGNTILDLAFSPDGTRLASASSDGTVRIWDPEYGTLLLVLRGHRIHATCVAWSKDGVTLATGGGDYNEDACILRLWQAPPATDLSQEIRLPR
jgi:eukaryotic-like serine/threonine-protein kinase